MKALLLSAGLGTRFQPQTNKIPKPALPFLNIPIMGYALYYLEQVGLDRLVVNLHHLPSHVKKATSQVTLGKPYELVFSDESGEILGSGGGIKFAESFLRGDGNFLVANADPIFMTSVENPVQKLLDLHQSSKALATLLVCPLAGVGSRFGGVWVDPQGQVKAIGKSSPGSGVKGYHFAGIQVFSDRIFEFLPEGVSHIFSNVLEPAMKQGERVQALVDRDMLWFETGDEKSYLEATKECVDILTRPTSEHHRPLQQMLSHFHLPKSVSKNVLSGPRSNIPASTVSPEAKVYAGRNVDVDATCKLKGFVVLGDGCSVANQIELENAVIGEGVHLTGPKVIKDSLVI